MNKRIIFSCVLDYTPVMAVQSYIWLTNLFAVDIMPKDIYVHLVTEVPRDFMVYLEAKGVNVVKKTPYDSRNKYCNKLTQLETFLDVVDYDYVFLMDCDTAVINLENIELTNEVYAKIVDFPNPPLPILQRIFDKNELQLLPVGTAFSIQGEQVTDWNNCNGGLYIIKKDFLKILAPKWIHYAKVCIEQESLFTPKYSKHADQVGFALALTSLSKKVTHLGIEWNYPIHVNNSIEVTPKIIHFHTEIDEHLQVKTKNKIVVAETLRIINSRINSSLEENLSNSLFWDYRYLTCPSLGSGVGSRGEVLELKINLLKHLTYGKKTATIMDIGCGDLELMKDMPFENYLGLDVSEEAVKMGKQKRPDWDFKTVPISDSSIQEVDITMCFDVLIHQSDANNFKVIVEKLVSKAKKRIIIGAYNEAPSFGSTITHFHNAIFNEVSQYNKFSELAIVKTYRDVSVLVGTVHENTHQRDIVSTNLNKAYKQVNRPDLLQYIVDVSRHHLGFYTAHYPRVFEYTWIIEQLEDKKDITVLDIGAGVCPVPLCLNDMGFHVTTVDLHPTVRKLEDKANWNEWGYLDYSVFNKAITSKHQDFTKVRSLKKFDCIYSISVIEHMPKAIRVKMLKRASKLLRKGGELLLTIDVAPNTNDIWNYSEGKLVESQEVHGTMESFKREIIAAGFKIISEHIQRDIFESRTDVWYIKATLERKSFL
ncbi:methyltransferase domain-containing protein [Lacinutrix sp. WUR7]|uniref:class I SAM-dependent methyltransferase n=1 Tax=Lacinutrix sp. WUR7 TaxID=2653681 RepID=UPI00193C98F1|nr:class I SAM-dependent methyltransferase [Lacinutrix sp. WUR7]QRM87803.1 methyltransferase domain-containing protein [Lacinutrix sp. WUR7]